MEWTRLWDLVDIFHRKFFKQDVVFFMQTLKITCFEYFLEKRKPSLSQNETFLQCQEVLFQQFLSVLKFHIFQYEMYLVILFACFRKSVSKWNTWVYTLTDCIFNVLPYLQCKMFLPTLEQQRNSKSWKSSWAEEKEEGGRQWRETQRKDLSKETGSMKIHQG